MVEVAVVDYGASNLKSIVRGLERAGAMVRVAHASEALAGADGLVIPGVGAAGAAMRGLRSRGLVAPLMTAIAQGTPFLGVCLGMQLLFGAQEEDDETGLGLLAGRVRRLHGVKVPHMGWNTVDVDVDVAGDAIAGAGHAGPLVHLPAQPYVYFVHSYYVELEPGAVDVTAGTTDYGGRFVSVVARENVWGTQFHPEKSGETGATVLRNFVARCDAYSVRDDTGQATQKGDRSQIGAPARE